MGRITGRLNAIRLITAKGISMKFEIEIDCPSCAQSHFASAYAEEPIVSPTCPKCGNLSHVIDPLTVSIGAERALCRSHAELQSGDFSISIICSAIAVE